MRARTSIRGLVIIQLIIAGTSLVHFAMAQVPPQNLFRRAQFIEYLKLQKPAYNGSNPVPMRVYPDLSPEFPTNCRVAAPAYQIWLEAESMFAFTKWEGASSIYSGMIKNDSTFCDAYFRLAQCYVAQGNLLFAFNILTIAEKKFPGNPLLYTGLGQLYTFFFRPNTALFYFQKQIILYPKDPEGFLGASWVLYETGRYAEAMSNLETGRKLLEGQIMETNIPSRLFSPNFDYLSIFESMLYLKTNQSKKSQQALKKIVTTSNSEILAYKDFCDGMYFYNKGEESYDKARRNFRNASREGIKVDDRIAREVGVRFDPGDFRSLVLMERYNDRLKYAAEKSVTQDADSLFENRLLKEAAVLYSEALQNDSTNCHTLVRLAECYRGLSRDYEALELYRSASRQFPNEIRFALLVARQLLQVNETAASIKAYEHVIIMDKRDPRGYFGACLVMAHIGKYGQALELFEKNPRLLNKRKSSWLKVMLYYKLDLPALALESYKSNLHPSAFIDYYVSLAYHSLGEEYADLASDNMLEAIRLGAIVSDETEKLVGLDPKVHVASK